MVVQDLATQWLQSYPCKTKTSQETQKSLPKFLEPTRKPKVIYTDNSLEFGKVCEDLSWNHCTSTPHRSDTNGIAERAVRGVKEGTSAVLLQSGLDEKWWADSMECYCYLRNIQDLLSDGKRPCERRFGMPLNGPVIPFGAMVEYHPTTAKDLSRLHQFAMLCRLQLHKHKETCCTVGQHKTKYACIVEADESMRIRMEGSQSKNHEDHIARRGMNSLSHYNLVHKFTLMPQAMKIPDAKSAVEKNGKNLRKYLHGI